MASQTSAGPQKHQITGFSVNSRHRLLKFTISCCILTNLMRVYIFIFVGTMHGSHFRDLLKHSMIHSIFHLVLVSSLQCVVFLGLLVFVMPGR